MSTITEDQLEKLCLDWFREEGYEIAFGPDIAHEGEKPERADYREVILPSRLLDALQRINPHIPKAVIEEQVVYFLGKPEHPVLIQNNRKSQKYLLNGVPVEYTDKDEKKGRPCATH